MKRLLLVVMAVFFLAGWGTAARDSEFYDHNTQYKSLDHMIFSMWDIRVWIKKILRSPTQRVGG